MTARRGPYLAGILAGLLAAPVSGAVEHVVFGVYGGRTLYRGYDLWVRVDMGWFDLKDFGADPTADTILVASHGWSNGDFVRPVPNGGTLPSPLSAALTYTVSGATPDAFKLWNAASGSYLDILDAGSGTLRIGRATTGAHAYITSVSGVPAGITYEYRCSGGIGGCWYDSGRGQYWLYGGGGTNGDNALWIRFRAAPAAALGDAAITFTFEVSGSTKNITVPLTVGDLTPVALGRPSSYPPVPGKNLWSTVMLSSTVGAGKWCSTPANPTEVFSFGVESGVWYYDGAWVYYQIADYTGNGQWNNCGRNISRQYMEYSLSGDGGIPAYRLFTDGLKRSCATCDARYRRLIERFINGPAPFALNGGNPREDYIRETAYRLEAFVSYERTYGARHALMTQSAALLLGMFDVLFIQQDPVFHQIPFDGLGMRALIRYYELTKDRRVPAAIKTALDWIWNNAWDDTGKRLIYNPYPYGPKCLSLCQQYENNLINLTAPAFAWFWSITGDDIYRSRGDELFQHAFDQTSYGIYSGKQFSQNYRWSFDYVNWREGKALNRP